MNAPTIPASLQLVAWTAVERNTLRGFASVKLRNGLTINDVSVHTTNGKSWASLPSKPMLDRNGMAVRDAANGKIRYLPVLAWPNKPTADRFSIAVVAAVEAAHPDAVRQ